MRVALIVLVPLASSLAGCASTQNVADPNKITLEQALTDTVDALAAANERSRKKDTHFGFYGCSVTATFNISASQTNDGKVTLSAGTAQTPTFPLSLSGTASSESIASGARGNTVTVVLQTKYCLPHPNAKSPAKGKDDGKVIQRDGAKTGSARPARRMGNAY